MIRLAANDGAETNDCIVPTGFRHFFRRERNLKRARHPSQIDRLRIDTVTGKRIFRAADEFIHDDFIETGRDDTDANFVFIVQTGNNIHDGSSFSEIEFNRAYAPFFLFWS